MSFLIVPLALLLGGLAWLPALGAWLGHRAAVPAAILGSLAAFLAGQLVSPLTGVDVSVAALLTAALVVAGGILAARRTGTLRARPGASAVATWVPALLGGALWVGTLLVGQLVPGAAVRAWAMSGDTQNNLAQALTVIGDHGVRVGSSENPVPLPAALVAGVIAPFRDGDRAALVAHGIDGFVVHWSALVVLTCLIVGAAITTFVDPARVRLTAVLSALGSLLPLTWFVSGMAFNFGYMNTHLVIVAVLCAWLLYRRTGSQPVLALVTQMLVGVLMLAIWAPLVLIPGLFGAFTMLRNREQLRTPSRRQLLALGLAVVPLILWTVLVTVAATREQYDSLAAGGNKLPLLYIPVLVLIAMLVATAVPLLRRGQHADGDALIAMSAATVLATAVLLFISRYTPEPLTTYYPLKITWIMTIVLSVVAAALAIGALTRVRWRAALPAAIAIPVVAVIVGGFVPPPTTPTTPSPYPMVSVLTGDIWYNGDASVDRIIELTDDDALTLLWRSGDRDEAAINLWLIVERTGFTRFPYLRILAYRPWLDWLDTGTTDDEDGWLCQATFAQELPITVLTADPELEADLTGRCAVPPTVRMLDD